MKEEENRDEKTTRGRRKKRVGMERGKRNRQVRKRRGSIEIATTQ